MCSCGCNTCETKIKGPLLTEGKVKSLLSEGLQYHIDKQIPLFETVYRIGSEKHLSLIKEARKMYSRGVIDLCEDDEYLIKTHFKNKAIAILPIDEEGNTWLVGQYRYALDAYSWEVNGGWAWVSYAELRKACEAAYDSTMPSWPAMVEIDA